MAQQIIPAAQLVPKYQSIERSNNYVVLQSITCSQECKIFGQILFDHPLSYALTATADVSVVYLQQFWRTIMETLDNSFVIPATIKIIESFMNRVGYQGVVDKDDIPLVSVYTMGNVTVRGMLISDSFLTKEIRATDDYKEYETMFVNVVVPMNQPQPVVSTQGTHRSTPRAHRIPSLTTASPQGKKRKQSAGETSSPQKSLKVTIKKNEQTRITRSLIAHKMV
ncbi:hypothetical protein Tco_1358252 [Tanacetum coccineum]